MKTFIFTLILVFGFASSLSAQSTPQQPDCANMDKAVQYVYDLGIKVVDDAEKCGKADNPNCIAQYVILRGLAQTHSDMIRYMTTQLKCFDI